MDRSRSRRSLPLLALFAGLAIAGCTWIGPTPQLRGNRIDADQFKELVPGTTTRADVTALLGSPTARATFDENTWLYVSEVTQPRIAATQAVLKQNVIVLSFNDQGVLQDVKRLNKDDSIPVSVVSRTTPSPGTEASFLQQLFGNIGRFNALPQQQTAPSGGAPAPAY